MRHGEAFVKVHEEMLAAARESAGVKPGDSDPPPEMLVDFTDALAPYMFDGTLVEFVDLRARKRASDMVRPVDFSNPEEAYGTLTSDLMAIWRDDLLSMFAMGFTFYDPEHSGVPRDKDGFVHLCATVDKNVIRVLVGQLRNDVELYEVLQDRVQRTENWMLESFSSQGIPCTKFNARKLLSQVLRVVSFDAFVGGAKVRELLEQEVAFETMMKEFE